MQMNRRLFYFLLFFLSVVIFSCHKDPTRIGLELQPSEDQMNVYMSDTTTIIAHSMLYDSVRTDETSVTMLGSYFDPVFGSSTVSLYTQLMLSSTSVNFGDNPVLDSIIFSYIF